LVYCFPPQFALEVPTHFGPGFSGLENGGYVPRVYRFIDVSGREIHTVNDPDDKLPIPADKQVISIGAERMLVDSVQTIGDPRVCTMYFVMVRTAAETN